MNGESFEDPPKPLRQFQLNRILFYVYASAGEMGTASAYRLADLQIQLAAQQERVGFLIMAAPSAYPFYSAYLQIARRSAQLRAAIHRTDYFQFDDYPLPADHPASFRRLINSRFIEPLRELCGAVAFHPLGVDAPDPARACREYASRVLAAGPDIQLKGVGENGHWGFHEPGIPLDGEPAYIEVETTAENTAQQLRDHPALFRSAEDVPRRAYTANVPLFLCTRVAIEDNVPQASKAFALLAGYGNGKIDAAVPTSALKQHHDATVRTTPEAAWALEQYAREGTLACGDVERLADLLTGGRDLGAAIAYIARVLGIMEIRISG